MLVFEDDLSQASIITNTAGVCQSYTTVGVLLATARLCSAVDTRAVARMGDAHTLHIKRRTAVPRGITLDPGTTR